MNVEARKACLIKILKEYWPISVHQMYQRLEKIDPHITVDQIRYVLKNPQFVGKKVRSVTKWRLANAEELRNMVKVKPASQKRCECGCAWCDTGGHCRNTDRGCHM